MTVTQQIKSTANLTKDTERHKANTGDVGELLEAPKGATRGSERQQQRGNPQDDAPRHRRSSWHKCQDEALV